MKPDFFRKLSHYEERLKQVREQEGIRIKDESMYEQLPFVKGSQKARRLQWHLKRHDLQILKRAIKDRNRMKVLDYGSWNGWLSNILVNWGHRVTAAGYFIDPYDGLGAKQFYRNDWHSLQMDMEDLSILEESYDCIIINRGIGFRRDPVATVNALKRKLNPGGILLATGLNYFRRIPALSPLEAARKYYLEKYGFDLIFRPTKGYLSLQEVKTLKQMGMKVRWYPQLLLPNLKSVFLPSRPFFCFGRLDKA